MTVRFAVVGTGNIGGQHIELLRSGAVPGAELVATASRHGGSADETVPHFNDPEDMLKAVALDAVLIATPTHSHVEIATAALERGLHVLMEKPIAMSVAQAEQLLDKVTPPTQFAVMLNQRFHPLYSRVKSLLEGDAIGALQRVSWIMTAWYRPDVYYKVSSWRGTWPGEGGGLLINQCIHNLDVLQWLIGLPESVFARVDFGRYHDIDVEDAVTALLTFRNGAHGVLAASSGEAPGVNRLELIGDRGSIVCADDAITLKTASVSVAEHCRTTREMFGMPAFESETLSGLAKVNQHAAVIANFVGSIEGEETLLTPGEAGLGSLQLANAMLLSAWSEGPVTLPIDARAYEKVLQQRIAAATLRTPENIAVEIDMDASYR